LWSGFNRNNRLLGRIAEQKSIKVSQSRTKEKLFKDLVFKNEKKVLQEKKDSGAKLVKNLASFKFFPVLTQFLLVNIDSLNNWSDKQAQNAKICAFSLLRQSPT
jgi:hypothetical protein